MGAIRDQAREEGSREKDSKHAEDGARSQKRSSVPEAKAGKEMDTGAVMRVEGPSGEWTPGWEKDRDSTPHTKQHEMETDKERERESETNSERNIRERERERSDRKRIWHGERFRETQKARVRR